MSVKHVSASKTPGLQAANPRRSVNIAAARPAQKSTVLPGEAKAFTESELAVAQALQSMVPPAADQTKGRLAVPRVEPPHAPEVSNQAVATPVAPLAGVGAAVDYYAIISKTVSGLALNNVETRSEVYDRARAVVEQRLKDASPAMSSHMVAVERIAFDRAIKKIEAEQLERQFARAVAGARGVREQAAPATAAPAAISMEQGTEEVAQPDLAPAILIAKRPRPAPPIRQMHDGTLRLFAVIGLVVAGLVGYWLTSGKPNLVGLRDLAHIVTKTPQTPATQQDNTNTALAPIGIAPVEQQTASAEAAATPPTPEALTAAEPASPATALSDEDVTSPNSYNVQLATFLSLCRPARTAYGDDACGNLQPRPFGGPGVTPRKAPEWIAMYASLSETIPARRVQKPVFTTPAPPAQASASALASDVPAGAAPIRTANATARERYTRGIDLAKNDNLDGAVGDFSEAIRLDPKFTDAYVQRGQAMFKNGNAERAIADFSQALQIDPRNAPAFKARGMAMLYKGDDDGAIVDLTKAIQYAEIDSSSIPSIEVFYARRSRAALYDRKQLYDRELIDLSAMIDGYWRDPSLAAALKNTYREQGAAALVATIYRLRSGVHQKRSNLDAAIGDLSFALQLDPSRTLQFLIERGRLLEAAGRRQQAIADYQQALELSPNNTDVRNSLARLKGRT